MSLRLPQDWIAILTQKKVRETDGLFTLTLEQLYEMSLSQLTVLDLIPVQTWANFNEDMVYWNGLNVFVKQGLMSKTDLPPKPNPTDYN